MQKLHIDLDAPPPPWITAATTVASPVRVIYYASSAPPPCDDSCASSPTTSVSASATSSVLVQELQRDLARERATRKELERKSRVMRVLFARAIVRERTRRQQLQLELTNMMVARRARLLITEEGDDLGKK